jgi:probable phosphoglycerate mutase
MKIYFARHGEYQNPQNVVPFQLPDFPLSDFGIEQSGLIASKLLTEKIRAIFTSPVERCLETASIIGKVLCLFPNQKEEIIETRTPLQGTKRSEFPVDIYVEPKHISGGGETKEEIITRMAEFVGMLKLTSKNSIYLIVSHGDPMMFYLRHVLKKDIRYIPMGGLVMLDYSQSGTPKYTEII